VTLQGWQSSIGKILHGGTGWTGLKVSSGKPLALNDRAQYFLKLLIERYLRDGQPVGSRSLAREAGTDLSPATIRNVMADLEELGLIAAPHTSAGRIPTLSGYRLFVDALISLKPPELADLQRIEGELVGEESPHKIIETTSKLLSELSHMAGIVLLPRANVVRIREIQFIGLSATRVLAVLVTHQGEVLNRILETAKPLERGELERAANFINAEYAGLQLEEMRGRLLREMAGHRRDLDDLMARALQMAQRALPDTDSDDFVVSGQTNLMDFDELARVDRLRRLFDAFVEKQTILHLLERCHDAEGVQIYLGDESGFGPLEGCSMVTSTYKVGGRVVGALGVIGPTRMAYDRVIPLVDITARLMGAALKSRESSP